MKQYSIKTLHSNYNGFIQLSELWESLSKDRAQEIIVDMSAVSWLDANMSAPLGAILSKASRNLNNVSVANVPSDVKQILSKNGFLGYYGFPAVADTWGTTIPYKRFEPKDDHAFAFYVHRHLRGHGMPDMSAALQKKFMESIFEIFSNAAIHSATKLGIYSCGQFYPKKHCLDFSVTDLGIGIRDNIESKKGITLDAVEAIEWAINGTNTTKIGPIPGGLGLKLLKEFIHLNKGRLILVSDRGYWESSKNGAYSKVLAYAFPGTAVNLEFNTADQRSYCLKSEINPDSVF